MGATSSEVAPAGDWLADAEVGATAVVDPEAALVETPGIAANAGRAADLADELDVAAVADVTPVSFAVVGRAGDELLLWGRRRAIGSPMAKSARQPLSTQRPRLSTPQVLPRTQGEPLT